jgi:branched-chain amino acid transport system permease protein
LGPSAIVYCLAAIGLNVHFGYTGLLNFGQAGFMAVGGYALASVVTTWGLSFWLGIVVGLLLTVLLALILGVPTLRLRADYLAIVTIAAAEIIRLIVRSVTFREYFGGSDGITRFADEFYALNPFPGGLDLGIIKFSQNDLWVVTVGWALIAFTSFVVWSLMRSPWGRVLKGIREDEDAVRSLGKNVYSYKMQALILGGVIGALGGFMAGVAFQSVQPDTYSTEFTFFVYTMLILGGAARIFGPILGAAIFWALLVFVGEFLNEAVNKGVITFLTNTQVGQIRFMLVGLGLMALMIFRPQGILGDRKELALDAR